MNGLLDEIGTNEKHPLYSLLDTLGTLIHAYEEEHFHFPSSTGTDVLRFLMEEHGLAQSDLSEIGSQGVVSEILNGKRGIKCPPNPRIGKEIQSLSRGVCLETKSKTQPIEVYEAMGLKEDRRNFQ